MIIAIGSDHAGFELKQEVRKFIADLGHEVLDVGAFKEDPSDDYPDFAESVG
ncbi:MAG: RpiB/LacA/LacB family sugar-phosphate isomerase, partial [Acidobacteriaceae bacterium]